MDILKMQRQLKALDAMEKRIKETVNPSKVLLDQIEKQRKELLNPKG